MIMYVLLWLLESFRREEERKRRIQRELAAKGIGEFILYIMYEV